MTKEERLNWLCRLRSGLVRFGIPSKERSMFEKALSEEIEVLSTKPCEDCISRQEVLKLQYRIDDSATLSTRDVVNVEDIEALSGVQPKVRWIPVTEDLPKTYDDVLVWFEYTKDDYDCAWWGLAYYSLRYKKWVVSTNGHNPIVKAWMPLPEPYESIVSESENKK